MKGYEKLDDVLARAFNQASQGKGAERHANELPFHEQPMQQVNAMVGVGFSNGQAIKKIVESQNMAPEKAVHELLGAICYLAGSIITIEARNDAPVFETMADLARAETFEYLDPKTWELHTVLGHQPISEDWILVPEGANMLTIGINQRVFWNALGQSFNIDTGNTEFSANENFNGYMRNHKDTVKILWSRNPLPKKPSRECWRNTLSQLRRGESFNLDGVNVTFDKDGYFHARLKGYLAEKTPSLNKILNYLENGN